MIEISIIEKKNLSGSKAEDAHPGAIDENAKTIAMIWNFILKSKKSVIFINLNKNSFEKIQVLSH